jgi:hypothetical protein
MNNGYVPSVSEVLDRVASVSLDEVHALAHQLWTQDRLTAVVGPE